ncbi:MAG: metallophosphoesterase, partial [Planktomarina sp.]
MTKIVLISDLHITKPGVLIIGLDPEVRLRTVLADILDTHADADHLILTGDLVHRGSRTEYARLRDILTDVPIPITVMPGNHDRRKGFATIFGHPFQQTVIDTKTHTLLCLDTLDEDANDLHSGILDDDRLEWLTDAVAATNKPLIILTHHPLGPVGFSGMDAIALRNGPQVVDILKQTNRVQLVISGHVHRAITGSYSGLPFTVLPSPVDQMPLDFEDTSSGA